MILCAGRCSLGVVVRRRNSERWTACSPRLLQPAKHFTNAALSPCGAGNEETVRAMTLLSVPSACPTTTSPVHTPGQNQEKEHGTFAAKWRGTLCHTTAIAVVALSPPSTSRKEYFATTWLALAGSTQLEASPPGAIWTYCRLRQCEMLWSSCSLIQLAPTCPRSTQQLMMQVMSSPPVRHLPLCSLFRSTIPIFVVNLADVTHIFHACAPSKIPTCPSSSCARPPYSIAPSSVHKPNLD